MDISDYINGWIAGIVSVGLTLMLLADIMAALSKALISLIPSTSNFYNTAQDILNQLASAFNITSIIPLILVASIILIVLKNIHNPKQLAQKNRH